MQNGIDSMFRSIAELALQHYEASDTEDFFTNYSPVLRGLSLDTGVHYRVICSRMETYIDALREPMHDMVSAMPPTLQKSRSHSSDP